MALDEIEVHEHERDDGLFWTVQFGTYDRATLDRIATMFDLPLSIVVEDVVQRAQASDISEALTDALVAIAHAGSRSQL